MEAGRKYEVSVVASLEGVEEAHWQQLSGSNPFVGHKFLSLMQSTGCVGARKGWLPQYVLLHRDEQLVGASACYLKSHSRGEFVFDQGWAEAFERHGLKYYPKLLVAAPFTPVQGPRLLAQDSQAREVLVQALLALTKSAGGSSAHVLFLEDDDREVLTAAGFMVREGVQFHWRNEGYASVDDFLAKLSHDKRKKIRQDGKYVSQAGITYSALQGQDISGEHLEFFYSCYTNTYREHWSTPYLSLEFFQEAHRTRALDFVLILAQREGSSVACALNVRGQGALYGRYWGTTEFIRGLHFETCYMQSIAYCIREGIEYFEGGAQGEHKMARGLLPTKTFSAHWVADRRFADAIEDFLQRETRAINEYVDGLDASSPFKDAQQS
jgi:predicted N-acyltransferase